METLLLSSQFYREFLFVATSHRDLTNKEPKVVFGGQLQNKSTHSATWSRVYTRNYFRLHQILLLERRTFYNTIKKKNHKVMLGHFKENLTRQKIYKRARRSAMNVVMNEKFLHS